MGDIHQKARKRLKKDVRAMLLHCANVGRTRWTLLQEMPAPTEVSALDSLLAAAYY
jgi:hypothetical protein